MPSNSTFSSQKEQEERLQKFQIILFQILNFSQQHPDMKKSFMSLLYRFLREGAKSTKVVPIAPLSPKSSKLEEKETPSVLSKSAEQLTPP
jgi:hypothetical protein